MCEVLLDLLPSPPRFLPSTVLRRGGAAAWATRAQPAPRGGYETPQLLVPAHKLLSATHATQTRMVWGREGYGLRCVSRATAAPLVETATEEGPAVCGFFPKDKRASNHPSFVQSPPAPPTSCLTPSVHFGTQASPRRQPPTPGCGFFSLSPLLFTVVVGGPKRTRGARDHPKTPAWAWPLGSPPVEATTPSAKRPCAPAAC